MRGHGERVFGRLVSGARRARDVERRIHRAAIYGWRGVGRVERNRGRADF